MLKDALCSAPILKYPDTSKLYTLYTDASKYGWARVLTQKHMYIFRILGFIVTFYKWQFFDLNPIDLDLGLIAMPKTHKLSH